VARSQPPDIGLSISAARIIRRVTGAPGWGTADVPVTRDLSTLWVDIRGVTMTFRSHAEVTRFFDGLELLEPGVVPANYWRPGLGGPDPVDAIPAYGAIGRKRAG
jgi:S-adenosyl methyltransferase